MNFAFLSDAQNVAVGWGAYKRSAKALKNSFYINDFELSQEPWIQFENHEVLSLSDFNNGFFNEFGGFLPAGQEWEISPKSAFEGQFKKAQTLFKELGLRKILLTTCDSEPLNDEQFLDSNKDLSALKRGLFFFAFYFEGKGAWGTTPEMLLSWNEKSQKLSTMALAGTFLDKTEARHEPEHEEVISFFKSVAEKNKVSVDIKNKESVSFGSIQHLKSEVTLSPVIDVDHWIRELHPTPALGVSPRNTESLKNLMELRKDLPKYFGAPMGFYGPWTNSEENECKLVVMIRGCFFDTRQLKRPIGVGVTPASDLESEWKEIDDKRQAMEEIWKAII